MNWKATFAVLFASAASWQGAYAQSGTSFLLIGDSHTYGTFGVTLDTLLRSREGAKVKTVGSCGISPNGFLAGLRTGCGLKIHELDQTERSPHDKRTPTIEALLAEVQPDLTIIALGANQIHTATQNPAAQRAFVERLVDQVRDSGSACLWVGPPHGRNKPEPRFSNLYRLLKDAIGEKCVFMDSRPEHLPFLNYNTVARQARRSGDGAHYDALGAHGRTAVRKWALEVFRSAERML